LIPGAGVEIIIAGTVDSATVRQCRRRIEMLFALIGKYNPAQLAKVHERENEVFESLPTGVNVRGRYTVVGGKGGFINIVEAESSEALAALLIRSAGTIEFEVVPLAETAGGRAVQLISRHLGEVSPMHGPVVMPEAPKEIEAAAVEMRKFEPPQHIAQGAHVRGMDAYRKLYRESVEEPERFWGEIA
jgi:hypothetical protein